MAVGLKIVNGDIVISASGNIEIVEQDKKCTRDFGKMLITEKEYNSNTTTYTRYNPDYGVELNNKSLFAGLSRMSIRDTIITLLNEAIKRYINLQESRDNLDIGEIITSINFDAYYDSKDARYLIVEIYFSTAYTGQQSISMGQFIQAVE